jgi:hypothetical protein
VRGPLRRACNRLTGDRVTARWEHLLDSIERGADGAVRRFTECADHPEGGAEPTSFPDELASTGDLGPLPPHLELRARAVLARVDHAYGVLRRVPRPTVEPGRTRFSSSEHSGAVTFDRTI